MRARRNLPQSRPGEGAPRAEPALPRGLIRYLYVTACVSGAAVMIVEILGARMLAPFVGTSHFVWTAQIAVTLAALACGYYVGGRWVDRSASLGRLYWALLIAGGYLSLTVALREWVAYRFLSLPLPVASLLTSVFLFFVPLSLLAMTGPFVVRQVTRALAQVGGAVGRLTAVSTIGSLLGTAIIGYVLIPVLPNSYSMYGTSVLLAAAAGGYLLGWGRRASAAIGMAAVAIVGLAAGFWGIRAEGLRSAGVSELYRGNSSFGMLQVVQVNGSPYRLWLNDYLIQNTYDTVQRKSTSMFTYMLEGLARAYSPQLDSALCIGMGIGIVPRELAERGVRVDVVEINPAVVPIAKRYFDLDPGTFHLTIGDGRYYVNRSRTQYDAVLLDAFLGESMPSHLMSREAFLAIRRVLKPQGVLVINTFVDFGSDSDYLGASLYKTLAGVFPSVIVHAAKNANTLFVASPRPDLSMIHQPDFAEVHGDALADVREAFATTLQPDLGKGIVLTDDYNPVEVYDAVNRERLRRALALSMRAP
ncbi:MAG TPA: fused MFS/spermidine synthase [Spirochaetia bacterium]|nr:fused MFS/spermidine synthase [Spirochaetia bacterium]